MSLRVLDCGDHFTLTFGPLPLIRRRINYRSITHVEAGRSRLIDGWSAHWIPRRGWTWNILGFDCATLVVDGKTLRVGSDDVERLVAFLVKKTGV